MHCLAAHRLGAAGAWRVPRAAAEAVAASVVPARRDALIDADRAGIGGAGRDHRARALEARERAAAAGPAAGGGAADAVRAQAGPALGVARASGASGSIRAARTGGRILFDTRVAEGDGGRCADGDAARRDGSSVRVDRLASL